MFNLDTDNPQQLISGYLTKGFKKEIWLDESTPTVKKNDIFFLFVSDSGAVTHPSISGHIRIKYTDA